VGHFGASRGFQLNWVGHFGASRGFQSKLGRTLQRVRRLQLINIRLIPNTALFCSFFLLGCVMCAAFCWRKHGVSKRLVVFVGRRDRLAADAARSALSVVWLF